MKVQFVGKGAEPVQIIMCEHCGNGSQAFKPVKEDILRIAFCGVCKKNSAGEVSPFNMAQFLKTGG